MCTLTYSTSLGAMWHALLTPHPLAPCGMPSAPHTPWRHVACPPHPTPLGAMWHALHTPRPLAPCPPHPTCGVCHVAGTPATRRRASQPREERTRSMSTTLPSTRARDCPRGARYMISPYLPHLPTSAISPKISQDLPRSPLVHGLLSPSQLVPSPHPPLQVPFRVCVRMHGDTTEYAHPLPPLATCHALLTALGHVACPPYRPWPRGMPSSPPLALRGFLTATWQVYGFGEPQRTDRASGRVRVHRAARRCRRTHAGPPRTEGAPRGRE